MLNNNPATHNRVVPIVVAVTGHRDLVAAEIPGLRARVRAFLSDLRDTYPQRSVGVMSALAEGADRLVAEEALALGVPLTVVLPMPRELYLDDFATEESRQQFEGLCAAAVDVFTLPLEPASTPESIAQPGEERTLQYAQAGVFLCAHCHILLALWDGKYSEQVGGTSQVVRFHHDDVMTGYTGTSKANRLILTDDESDLVYHIVASRDRSDGEPAAGLAPLDAFWFTSDDRQPRTREMPLRHRQVFARTSEFSHDVRLHAGAIAQGSHPLLTREQAATLPLGLQDIDEIFCAADWLAIHYQKKVLRTLHASHTMVLLMGYAFVLYSDFDAQQYFLFALLGLLVAFLIVNELATRGSWHRKYLDYRTLAEGLRVQFYWAAAGVASGTVSKFAHDNFLQMQDAELGWIRNVMRVAGTECDVAPSTDPAGLRFAIEEWIGDSQSGQLGYYRRKGAERAKRYGRTVRLGKFGMWAIALALAVLLFGGDGLTGAVHDAAVVAIGLVLLTVGLRQSYAKNTAESELIKQYEFMYRIFHNARRRIDAAANDGEKRGILKVLGDAALEEHAEWILMHRERSMKQQEMLSAS